MQKKTTVKDQSEIFREHACVVVNTRYIPVRTNEEKKKSESALYFYVKERKEESD